MSNHCIYKFVTGTKKNTFCDRFIRAQNSNYCYQHKPKEVKPKEEEVKATISENIPKVEVKVESAMSPIKKKGKPVKINESQADLSASVEIPKVITTKTNNFSVTERFGNAFNKTVSKPIDIPAEKPKEEESFEQLEIAKESESSSSYSISDSSSDLDTSSDSE